MKILIEKNVKTFADGRVEEYYRVKYKRGWWYPFWMYLEQHYSHANSEVKNFSVLEDAKKAARKLRDDHIGPDHVVTDLDVNGKPVLNYSGG